MKSALLFPGQGSQAVGMGRSLYDNFSVAKAVFDEVDAALGEKLSTLIFEGPEADLTLTANAQPALMAVSMAVLRVLEAEKGLDLKRDVAFVAGHSLGEYSALAAARALTLSDTARLLRLRGNAMQKATPVGTGAMAAILGLEYDAVAELAAAAVQGDVCSVANDNGAGQVVISGDKAAVERAIAAAPAKGAKRAIPLPVSAPFHCALMQPAAEAMREALRHVTISAPVVPVVVNVMARPSIDPLAIQMHLVTQVTGTVRWRESIEWLAAQGVSHFYELGAGKVLSGIAKRIATGANASSFGTADDIAKYITA